MLKKLLNLWKNKKIEKIKNKYALDLLKKRGVVCVRTGNKVKFDFDTGKKCIKVLVEKKKDKKVIAEKDLVPVDINGVLTDVEEMDMPKAFSSVDRMTYRPLSAGCEISPKGVGFVGTLGNFFYRTKISNDNGFVGYLAKWVLPKSWLKHFKLKTDIEVLCGTNLHVAAPYSVLESPIGTKIVQPGGSHGSKIGEVIAYGEISEDGFNEFDEAIIRIYENLELNEDIIQVGKIKGISNPKIGTKVKKYGRTTGYTEGTITDTGVFMNIDFGLDGIISFKDLVEVSSNGSDSFSDSGDSGSAIVDENNNLIARLNSGNGRFTYGIPASKIVKKFKISVINDESKILKKNETTVM